MTTQTAATFVAEASLETATHFMGEYPTASHTLEEIQANLLSPTTAAALAVASPVRVPEKTECARVSKQEQRYVLLQMFDPLRYAIEKFVSSAVNDECGSKYQGIFEVRFAHPNDINEKTLSNFCTTGDVLFVPHSLDDHAALKKVRNATAGINLSAL